MMEDRRFYGVVACWLVEDARGEFFVFPFSCAEEFRDKDADEKGPVASEP